MHIELHAECVTMSIINQFTYVTKCKIPNTTLLKIIVILHNVNKSVLCIQSIKCKLNSLSRQSSWTRIHNLSNKKKLRLQWHWLNIFLKVNTVSK